MALVLPLVPDDPTVRSRHDHPSETGADGGGGDARIVSLPRRRVDLLAIAQGFAVSAADMPELLHAPERTWTLLAATDLFEAWAIGWPPGGTIELHDHGDSRGAFVVAAGTLHETSVRPTDRGVARIRSRVLGVGQHRTIGVGAVHDIINVDDEGAVSVHVYGPKLTTMTYFELDGTGRLSPTRTEHLEPVGPFDVTRSHDPS